MQRTLPAHGRTTAVDAADVFRKGGDLRRSVRSNPPETMKFSPYLAAALAASTVMAWCLPGYAWSPKKAAIMTPFAKDVDPANPLPEYPRPQMERAEWRNLNGVWEYQPGNEGDTLPAGKKLPSEILVPFPVEAALSGVMEHHDRLWYRRTFNVPQGWAGKRTLLHFGAVDWEAEVFVNGKSLGVHRGGYDPFAFDVTDALKEAGNGEQELIVRVFDPTDDAGEPRGKQSLHPGGIMYTPTTGIWQTVWLEPVAPTAILDLKLVPDLDKAVLRLTATTSTSLHDAAGKSNEVKVTVKDGEQTVATFSGPSDTELSVPVPDAKLWSPDSPFLYNLEVSLQQDGKEVDRVQSYFGMRKIELGEENGVKKMMLNGKFVFEFGPLDQGFWPDGIYTQPTEAALKYDIEMMKRYGFNMVRKHIKVEPARWYYWTDKLGLMVWQDMPSANSYIDKKKYQVPPVDNGAFKTELQRLIETHWNAPSIIMWDTFNEAQGQHDTVQLAGMIKKLDPSRLVNEASGGSHVGAGDVYDDHHYPPAGLSEAERVASHRLRRVRGSRVQRAGPHLDGQGRWRVGRTRRGRPALGLRRIRQPDQELPGRARFKRGGVHAVDRRGDGAERTDDLRPDQQGGAGADRQGDALRVSEPDVPGNRADLGADRADLALRDRGGAGGRVEAGRVRRRGLEGGHRRIRRGARAARPHRVEDQRHLPAAALQSRRADPRAGGTPRCARLPRRGCAGVHQRRGGLFKQGLHLGVREPEPRGSSEEGRSNPAPTTYWPYIATRPRAGSTSTWDCRCGLIRGRRERRDGGRAGADGG